MIAYDTAQSTRARAAGPRAVKIPQLPTATSPDVTTPRGLPTEEDVLGLRHRSGLSPSFHDQRWSCRTSVRYLDHVADRLLHSAMHGTAIRHAVENATCRPQ
jgi:hypothetical protein